MLEFEYSRLPIIRTFKGNGKKFELSGFRVIEGKIIWKLFGREKKFELAGGSSYGGFELPGVDCISDVDYFQSLEKSMNPLEEIL